jgi:predicted alpha/beta superfamily hydrolase
MRLVKHEAFQSSFLDDRDVTVYLPPDYHGNVERRYPVLYLQDGQNLFDPKRAFKKGEHWRVAETANALIDSDQLDPLIIVGIDNTGPRRAHEYTPSHDRRRGGGGADDYGRLIVTELKPFIDDRYRTLPDAEHTGLGGSSLGGLVSLYLGLKYPHVFTRLAVMSPSVWWDRRVILKHVRAAKPCVDAADADREEGRRLKPPLRIWVDIGTREGHYHVENARLLKTGLVKSGWIEGDDLHYEETPGATHGEAAWADRFGRVVQFLFP